MTLLLGGSSSISSVVPIWQQLVGVDLEAIRSHESSVKHRGQCVRDRKLSGGSQKEIWVLRAPLFWVIVRSEERRVGKEC